MKLMVGQAAMIVRWSVNKKGGGGNAGPGYLKKNEHFFQKYGAELKQVE